MIVSIVSLHHRTLCNLIEYRQHQMDYHHMNSYLRLLIHKVAIYYKMGHEVDLPRKCISLYKLPESQV